jgi:hypothetical protein
MSQKSLPLKPAKAPGAALHALFAEPQRRHYSVEDKTRMVLEGEQRGGTQPPRVNFTNALLITEVTPSNPRSTQIWRSPMIAIGPT